MFSYAKNRVRILGEKLRIVKQKIFLKGFDGEKRIILNTEKLSFKCCLSNDVGKQLMTGPAIVFKQLTLLFLKQIVSSEWNLKYFGRLWPYQPERLLRPCSESVI